MRQELDVGLAKAEDADDVTVLSSRPRAVSTVTVSRLVMGWVNGFWAASLGLG
jgi:hypothetical protein